MFFADPKIYCLDFLTAISNAQIVQWMWFYPPDGLPVIEVVFSNLKTNPSRWRIFFFKTRSRSQDTLC